MDNVIITVLILASVSGFSCQRERCLYSRLDFMPCIYRNRNLMRAGDNQYSIHHTKLRQSDSGFLECNVKARNQIIRDITDLGTDNVKILFSPGFYQKEKYDNQLLVEYRVRCAEGQLAYFNITALDMQGMDDCKDDEGHNKCQDSLIIDRGAFGSTEVCGNRIMEFDLSDSYSSLQPESFKIFFRTSETARYEGFEMYVVCFRDEALEECFRPSDFYHPVCNNATGSGDITMNNNRKKRYTDENEVRLTYGDFFTGYPSGMKIRRDLAEFHNQWHRLRRQAEVELQFFERNILFNESVDYIDNTIIIFDPDNNTVETYSGIYVLQTFNTTGGINTYIRNAEERGVRPHFISAGPLIITGRYAFFQLFVIDPRGLIPDPEEEEQLMILTRSLLDAVPLNEDLNVTDPNQTIEEFIFFENGIGKRQVELNGVFSSKDENERKKRQDDSIDSNLDFTDEGVFAILRNLEACNPVVRTQAQANLDVYNRTDSERLQKLFNFTISCTLQLNGIKLECMVDGPTAVLPFNTTCQINDQPPEKCDPFYEAPVMFPDDMMIETVIVRAINCNGQRAKQCLDKDGNRLDCY